MTGLSWHTSCMDFPALASVLAAVVGAVGAALAAWQSSVWASRAEKKERDRLTSEVLGSAAQPRIVVGERGVVHIHARSLEGSDQDSSTQTQEDIDPDSAEDWKRVASDAPSGTTGAVREKQITETETTYDKLLINDYALGLTQARRAFNVSTVFSVLGGLVLIVGVSLAIFRADTGGQVAGAIITSSAGVLTSGLSQLFRGQSTKALKHLEAQAAELRQDVRTQTNTGKALRLLQEVDDEDLRARLQAALILKFSDAVLPDLGSHLKPRDDLTGSRNSHTRGSTTDQQ